MVTKKTLIREIEETVPHSNALLARLGMGRIATLVTYFDTIGEGALANGVDPDVVVSAINESLANSSLANFS